MKQMLSETIWSLLNLHAFLCLISNMAEKEQKKEELKESFSFCLPAVGVARGFSPAVIFSAPLELSDY